MQNRLLGNYRVISRIGAGGRGMVYCAEHMWLDREVAIKVLRPELSTDSERVTRFFKEARAAARLRHPGIVEVFDVGHCEDGAGYVVMELLRGESLASRLAREGRLRWPQACSFARQIASALATAHRARIVHRELKPANVFLVTESDQPGERTKVLDFGIAKLADGGVDLGQARPDLVMGTPVYMSPQQCCGVGTVDHRADIYSLGCVLFEMVCGRPPFEEDDICDLVTAHMRMPPPSPGWLAPEQPDALERLILRMLAKREEDRPQSMEEVAAALDAIVETSGVVTEIWVGSSPGEARAVSVGLPPRRRSLLVFAAMAVVGLASLAATAVAYERAPVELAGDVSRESDASVSGLGSGSGSGGDGWGKRGGRGRLMAASAALLGEGDGTPTAANVVPRRVVHEIGCDPECEVMLDGAVVGRAAPWISYRVEISEWKGRSRTYVLRPIGSRHRETSYLAPADRSVKAMIHLPRAPRATGRAARSPPDVSRSRPSRRNADAVPRGGELARARGVFARA